MPRKKQFADPEPIVLPQTKLAIPPSVDRLLMGSEGVSYRQVTTILVNGAHTLQPSNGTPTFHRHTELMTILYAAYNRDNMSHFLLVLKDYLQLAVGQFPHAGRYEDIEPNVAGIKHLMESVENVHEALGIKQSGFRLVAGKMLTRANAPL